MALFMITNDLELAQRKEELKEILSKYPNIQELSPETHITRLMYESLIQDIAAYEHPIRFYYTNHKGVRSLRRVRHIFTYRGTTEFHPTETWLFKAWDLDRKAERTFVLYDMEFDVSTPNTGLWNTGSHNTGNSNVGYHNIGSRNVGSQNFGSYNTGDQNFGGYNSGNYNQAWFCTGDFNVGERSTGIFCTVSKEESLEFFDKPSYYSYNDWEESTAYKILSRLKFTTYNEATKQTDELNRYKVWAAWWESLTPGEKFEIFAIPNFDPDKFEEITDLNVREELKKVWDDPDQAIGLEKLTPYAEVRDDLDPLNYNLDDAQEDSDGPYELD